MSRFIKLGLFLFFVLGTFQLVSAGSKEMYDLLEIKDPSTVARFLSELQLAITKNDRDHIGSLVRYPLVVHLQKGKDQVVTLKIQDKPELLKKFASVFTEKVRKEILAAHMENIDAHKLVLHIHPTGVWFDKVVGEPDKYQIVTVNP